VTARPAGLVGLPVAAALALALVLGGCSSATSASSSDGHTGTITVYAASSLTGSFATLGARFEKAHPGAHIRFHYGASGTLATQINEGAPADVFASAAPKNMATVVSAGNAGGPVTFVKNRMEIAAAPGNPAHVRSLADLARSSVQVALCQPTVPCGVVAQRVLKNANVTVKPVASEPDVKATLATVEQGEVDAGLVYVTDVRAAGPKVAGVPVPDRLNATTEYPIAALTHARKPGLAKAFVAYVRSADGLKVLTAAGFLSP
jgi:molybdate transport system substrate-binding protein